MEGIGQVLGRGKPARADDTRWLVGWAKGDKEGRTTKSRSDWATLGMDMTAVASE